MIKALCIYLFSFGAFAGGVVGNGGDSVNCSSNKSVSQFSGYYNLDYLIAKLSGMEYSDDFELVIPDGDRFDTNFDRILAAFKDRYPGLYFDLQLYRDSLLANKYGEQYVWKQAPFGTVDTDDENLRQKIPPNCIPANEKPLIQTVLRTSKLWGPTRVPHTVETINLVGADFTYSPSVINKLSSLQQSFLYFHEWLRNFHNDPEVIRDANAVLHSAGWQDSDVDRKVTLLNKLLSKPVLAITPGEHLVGFGDLARIHKE